MPLAHYGVLLGTLVSHHRDLPDDQGRWFHVHLLLSAQGREYRCAVDVDSKQSAVGVEWKTVSLTSADLGPVGLLGEGYAELARDGHSGAVDCSRSRWLRPSDGYGASAESSPAWTRGSNLEAATALEAVLVPRAEILVFGEPFTIGFGMHNVHQNQGDPAGSQWWPDNGTWQDGATLVRGSGGALTAFVSKFTSQAYVTDSQGHPV